ncbi:MAG: pantoate--beta-alanine ligase, partial [Gemmataceae bacterium]
THLARATAARRRIEAGERDAEAVREGMREHIASVPAAVLDYAAVVDADTLQDLVQLTPSRPVLLALAVTFGGTRLIDNLLIGSSERMKDEG